VKGDIVYSNNSEDFRFNDAEECLEDAWNNFFDGCPKTMAIYQATDTGIAIEDFEDGDANEVTDFIELTYRRTNVDIDFPSWELTRSVKSASKQVWREPT